MRFFYIAAIILLYSSSPAQSIINAYARAGSVTGGSVINVANVNEANHTFTVGGKVIVMQMQDNVIGTNTTNVVAFGDLSNIANAGRYEVAYIASRSPASGTPTTITLAAPLANTYNTGSNSSVQIISFRDMGSNYTTTANITGLAWNGNVGGVIAFEVTNTLTLNHSISANLIGFREGARSASAGGGCDPGTYLSNSNLRGFKGEGIYRATDATFTNARGHIINGGGGGNEHNAGGAGGGNYTAGGAGGPGYGCGTNAGGIGGALLSAHISSSRVFMGGGGGGGGQNNGANSDGGKGGGIILIRASTLLTNNVCGSPVNITSNGGSAANIGNDGAGGGGSGGSIVLDIANFSASASCPLTVQSNGGSGGDCNDGTVHAGGGGGGQGVVIYTIAQPTVNITTSTASGAGGKNNSAGSSTASPGGGSVNSGIIPAAANPLPVALLYFRGTPEKGTVNLYWETATEKNNAYFSVEKSANGTDFTLLGTRSGAGTSLVRHQYQLHDKEPARGLNYYRLSQTDDDGASRQVGLIVVPIEDISSLVVSPNPVASGAPVSLSLGAVYERVEFNLYDVTGKVLFSGTLPFSGQSDLELDLSSPALERGVYFLQVKNGYAATVKKLVIN